MFYMTQAWKLNSSSLFEWDIISIIGYTRLHVGFFFFRIAAKKKTNNNKLETFVGQTKFNLLFVGKCQWCGRRLFNCHGG